MLKEEAFKSILSTAKRILDAYGMPETSDSARIIYAERELNVASENGIIEIFFRGSLVFRHDPKGETTDFYVEHGVWMEAIEQLARNIPQSSADNRQ